VDRGGIVEVDPQDAPGLTDDDVALLCVRAEDGQLRWQIV